MEFGLGPTKRETVCIPTKSTPPALFDMVKEVAMVNDCQWIALHDHMPGTDPERTLRVYGSCTCPTPGYVLTLRYKEPQGINPKDLLLELISNPPTGPVPDVLWPCTAEYEQTTAMEYETVTILGYGGGTAKVEHPV